MQNKWTINNLIHANKTILVVEYKKDLQNLLKVVRNESRKKGLDLTLLLQHINELFTLKQDQTYLNVFNKKKD